MKADQHSQSFYFRNLGLKVSAAGKYLFQYEQLGAVPDKTIINHDINAEEPHFKITEGPEGALDINILRSDNMFLNFMINASRMYWRKEFTGADESYKVEHKFDIAGPALSLEEQAEQKLHLINKIYALGYMLHNYKDYRKAWAVVAVNSKAANDNGIYGTGKSLFMTAVSSIQKYFFLPGRNPKLADDAFLYYGVTPETDYVLVDDCNRNLNFDFFFSNITGSTIVERRGEAAVEIPFEESPKFLFTADEFKRIDSSTSRRCLMVVFSDYYHWTSNFLDNSATPYSCRKVKDDFGKLLFKNWNEVDWNTFYNFIGDCVSFYLSHDKKINPPGY